MIAGTIPTLVNIEYLPPTSLWCSNSKQLLSFAILYSSSNLNAWGVCVNNKLFLLRLNIRFWVLYFIVSFELIIGITALFFIKFLAIFFSSLIEKLGLAASCINTFFGLYFFRYFKALKEESDLSFPPLIILIDLWYFFF